MAPEETAPESVELMWTEVDEESDDDEMPATASAERTAAVNALLVLEQSHVALLRDLDQVYLSRAVTASLTTPALRDALAVVDPRRSLVQLTGIVQLLADRHDALAETLLRTFGEAGVCVCILFFFLKNYKFYDAFENRWWCMCW